MYNNLYEIINYFEIRDKQVVLNKEKLTLNVYNFQSDIIFKIKVIEENKIDFLKSLVELI
ncbi:MAG: hypothetical protein ACRCZ1_01360 [Cetobacterium sp.]